MNELPEDIELLNPENLKVVQDCIEIGKDDGDVATIHVDRLQALLDGYKSSLAANREQKAEIERLERRYLEEAAIVGRVWKALGISTYEQAGGKAIDEIVASLRTSVGEKWIEVKEGCEVPEYGETIHAICTSGAMEPWQEVFEATFTMGWEEMAACGVTYWKRLKWPVAPPPPYQERRSR